MSPFALSGTHCPTGIGLLRVTVNSPILNDTSFEPSNECGLGNQPSQTHALAEPVYDLYLRSVPHILHGLSEDAVTHELVKVFLKVVPCDLSGLRINFDEFLNEVLLLVRNLFVNLPQNYSVFQVTP